MLMPSAISVTYMSDIAKFAMKMDSSDFMFFITQSANKIRIFPHVPTRPAKRRITMTEIATPGDSVKN